MSNSRELNFMREMMAKQKRYDTLAKLKPNKARPRDYETLRETKGHIKTGAYYRESKSSCFLPERETSAIRYMKSKSKPSSKGSRVSKPKSSLVSEPVSNASSLYRAEQEFYNQTKSIKSTVSTTVSSPKKASKASLIPRSRSQASKHSYRSPPSSQKMSVASSRRSSVQPQSRPKSTLSMHSVTDEDIDNMKPDELRAYIKGMNASRMSSARRRSSLPSQSHSVISRSKRRSSGSYGQGCWSAIGRPDEFQQVPKLYNKRQTVKNEFFNNDRIVCIT